MVARCNSIAPRLFHTATRGHQQSVHFQLSCHTGSTYNVNTLLRSTAQLNKKRGTHVEASIILIIIQSLF